MQLTADLFKAIGDKSKALILIGYATGTSPSYLNPFIEYLTQKGIPVFIIPKNPADDFGVRSIKYEVQQEAVDAGAIPLRNANINNALDVVVDIQKAINGDKIGQDLADAIVEKYGSPLKK